MQEKSGLAFEDRVFGHHSSGDSLVARFWDANSDFSGDVSAFIREKRRGPKFPNTKIGKSIYDLVVAALIRMRLDPTGMFFASCINTKLDLKYSVDGIIHLPQISNFPVTFDLMHIDPKDLIVLKDEWVRNLNGQFYSETQFQNDLFAYKCGGDTFFGELNRKRLSGELPYLPIKIPDLRFKAKSGRPENHFVLTPYNTDDPQRRKAFAEMVARYLATVAKNGSIEP